MKFDLFSHVAWPEDRTPKQVIDDLTEQIQLGEELGFNGAWHAEHHFTRYGLGSSSMVLGASIAARTKKIRLGTAVLVPPLHNPVRLAEDTATLDAISGGRLDVGFGRGMDTWEYKAFYMDWQESQERFREAIAVIKGLWTTPEFSHEGKYFRTNQTSLVPPPAQKPHPPIYLAASQTPATLEFVVSTGHPLIVGQALDTPRAIDLAQRFVEMSHQAGYNVPMWQVPFQRFFYVAETEEQARKDTRASVEWMADMVQWRRTFEQGSEVHHRIDDWRKNRTEPSDPDRIYNRAFIGTPDQCGAKIKELEDVGIEQFACYFDFGGMEHLKVMRSMELFAEKVMPHFT